MSSENKESYNASSSSTVTVYGGGGHGTNLGEVVDELVQVLAQLGQLHELAEILGRQVVVPRPRHILLLNLPDDVGLQAARELPQRRLSDSTTRHKRDEAQRGYGQRIQRN